MKARVLMYHDVVAPGAPSGFPGTGAEHYKLDPSLFRQHLDALTAAAAGDVVTVAELRRVLRPWTHDAPVLLTFDDGGVSAFEVTAPELERRGLRGHFFVTTGQLGQPGFLTPEQVVELARRGHVIGTHSDTHPSRIDRLSPAELAGEWQRSVDRLRSLLGTDVVTGSIPGGHYSIDVARAAARAGVRQLFTSEPTSESWMVGGVELFGRYAVTRMTPPSAAVGYATGALEHVLPQWTLWQLKKLGKTLAGPSYEAARLALLSAEQKLRPSRRNP